MADKLPTTFEKKWPTVILPNITIANDIVTVTDTVGLHTKQEIVLSKIGLEQATFEIKRVISDTQLHIGLISKDIATYSNPTEYSGGTLTMSEQGRNLFGADIVLRSVYEEEPAVALRTMMVDPYGQRYKSITDSEGIVRFPVDANLTVENLHVDIDNPTTPFIGNVECTLASTEYSYILPDNTKRFTIKVRDGHGKLQMSYVAGQTGTTFITIPYGCERPSGDIDIPNGFTLYFRCSLPNKIVEIESWGT